VHFSVIYNSRAHFGFAKRGRNHTRLHEAPFRFRFELRASRASAPRFRFELRASRAPTPRIGFGFVSFRLAPGFAKQVRLFGFECHPNRRSLGLDSLLILLKDSIGKST
jgi:hypothetical protein